MSLKLGLEVEFFLTKSGKLVDVGLLGLPHDEYPLLAEARGDPFNCAFKAVASVRAEIERICSSAKKLECKPRFTNWEEKDKHVVSLHEAILRRGLSKRISWENLHNHGTSEKNETHLSAGLHVSFTNPRIFSYSSSKNVSSADGKVTISVNDPKEYEYNPLFDFAKIFRKIEVEFGGDIKLASRTPGFYEIKSDGRVEYRSLPATLIHAKNFAARLAECTQL